jgi:hypothetical protein
MLKQSILPIDSQISPLIQRHANCVRATPSTSNITKFQISGNAYPTYFATHSTHPPPFRITTNESQKSKTQSYKEHLPQGSEGEGDPPTPHYTYTYSTSLPWNIPDD